MAGRSMAALLALSLLVLAACGGTAGSGGPPPPPVIAVTSFVLACAPTSIEVGAMPPAACSASKFAGTGNFTTAVTFTAAPSSVGTVDGSGKVTTLSAGTLTVTATSVQTVTVKETATITVTAPPPPFTIVGSSFGRNNFYGLFPQVLGASYTLNGSVPAGKVFFVDGQPTATQPTVTNNQFQVVFNIPSPERLTVAFCDLDGTNCSASWSVGIFAQANMQAAVGDSVSTLDPGQSAMLYSANSNGVTLTLTSAVPFGTSDVGIACDPDVQLCFVVEHDEIVAPFTPNGTIIGGLGGNGVGSIGGVTSAHGVGNLLEPDGVLNAFTLNGPGGLWSLLPVGTKNLRAAGRLDCSGVDTAYVYDAGTTTLYAVSEFLNSDNTVALSLNNASLNLAPVFSPMQNFPQAAGRWQVLPFPATVGNGCMLGVIAPSVDVAGNLSYKLQVVDGSGMTATSASYALSPFFVNAFVAGTKIVVAAYDPMGGKSSFVSYDSAGTTTPLSSASVIFPNGVSSLPNGDYAVTDATGGGEEVNNPH